MSERATGKEYPTQPPGHESAGADTTSLTSRRPRRASGDPSRPSTPTRQAMEAPTGGGIGLAVVQRFVDVAVDALADTREEIDALNVYPVPDGDTGTNMYLTMSAARDAIHDAVAQGLDLDAALTAFRRGALLGARGNSGVILSQMLGALAIRIARADARRAQRDGDGGGDGRGDRRQLRRGRYAGRGHDPDGRPRRRRCRRTTCRGPARPRPRRVHRGRRRRPRGARAHARPAPPAARGGRRRRGRSRALRDPRRRRDRAHRPSPGRPATPARRAGHPGDHDRPTT